MSNEAMLVADLGLNALIALCILCWGPVLICWALCFIAWMKGYPDTMTVAEILQRLTTGVAVPDGAFNKDEAHRLIYDLFMNDEKVIRSMAAQSLKSLLGITGPVPARGVKVCAPAGHILSPPTDEEAAAEEMPPAGVAVVDEPVTGDPK